MHKDLSLCVLFLTGVVSLDSSIVYWTALKFSYQRDLSKLKKKKNRRNELFKEKFYGNIENKNKKEFLNTKKK